MIIPKLKVLLLICCILASFYQVKVFAQDYPYRVGLKIGCPQVAGLNLEYLTPLFNKKISIDVDGSYLPLPLNGITENLSGLKAYLNEIRTNTYFNGNISNVIGTFTYTNIAISFNYYIFKPGEGLYAGLGLNIMNMNVSGSASDTIKNFLGLGKLGVVITGNASKEITSYFLKIGGKHGKHYYFRWELGYRIAPKSNSDIVNFTGTIDGITLPITNLIVNLPSYISSGPNADIGFGICF